MQRFSMKMSPLFQLQLSQQQMQQPQQQQQQQQQQKVLKDRASNDQLLRNIQQQQQQHSHPGMASQVLKLTGFRELHLLAD